MCYYKHMQDNDTSFFREFIRNKYIKLFLILDIIAILAVIGLLIYRATRISKIYFNVAPLDATISVNGVNYSSGQHDITPGSYEIKISADGLEAKTLSINIEPHHYVTVATFLSDNGKTFEYYKFKKNQGSYLRLKSIASAENNITTDSDTSAQDFIIKYEQALTIYDKLPLKGYLYEEPSVSMSTGGFAIQDGRSKDQCDKMNCLIVRCYGKNYENAVLEKIKEAGYNPEDYQIIYERNS